MISNIYVTIRGKRKVKLKFYFLSVLIWSKLFWNLFSSSGKVSLLQAITIQKSFKSQQNDGFHQGQYCSIRGLVASKSPKDIWNTQSSSHIQRIPCKPEMDSQEMHHLSRYLFLFQTCTENYVAPFSIYWFQSDSISGKGPDLGLAIMSVQDESDEKILSRDNLSTLVCEVLNEMFD